MALDTLQSDILGQNNSPSVSLEIFCRQVNNILDLEGKKQGILRFQLGVNGWGNDSDVLIPYTIRVISPKHWQDESSVEKIEITFGDFSGIFNGVQIGKNDEQQLYIELYFEKKGIDLFDEVRKVYFGC